MTRTIRYGFRRWGMPLTTISFAETHRFGIDHTGTIDSIGAYHDDGNGHPSLSRSYPDRPWRDEYGARWVVSFLADPWEGDEEETP